MNDEQIEFWLNLSEEISYNVEDAINMASKDPDVASITKIGADGTPTHKIDEYAENAAIKTIEATGKSLILISEEIGTVKIGEDTPEVVLIMDPLDGTTNALKHIPCYGISIAIAENSRASIDDITMGDIQIGYVKNFANEDTYIAIKGRGAKKNNEEMKLSGISKLSEATVCNYVYREDANEVAKIISCSRRMRLMGAIAVEICYVADGTYDVFLDTKSVRLLDIAAAQLILKENGGIVSDTDTNELASSLKLMGKTSVVATTNQNIHNEVIELINN
ncbi:MAG: bifunctional fructose-bisphosphatase/inositol-phosphate phosphatase [Methanosphaera sp.]|uniref:bifunctional fructose-bisphosphatase/inositol-phosphate phosphatase n=1 Tax=Methanosphaera sp. TaxID=2666342 RepID=UPI0025EA66F1|nr:bifunctional fructose-bisphosphatase/inositol-phosphate phosphatase [Methanosphaera sp.]MCI5867447.1 bifunctional fructose-bisphosphatase/inositol-phosphate phosphatase [Methanosphaera sp.]MDD6534485.1 bifunctional fructose-bisphosphatase/inositol-phosphate phosphatase [Methanosphaera sp.]MDY3955846.1 bifunctional fructose-bisphosphatase/inositol-phosphate phosphatase [Methanosphaera sp.]